LKKKTIQINQYKFKGMESRIVKKKSNNSEMATVLSSPAVRAVRSRSGLIFPSVINCDN